MQHNRAMKKKHSIAKRINMNKSRDHDGASCRKIHAV